ncbi:MAG: glutathione binding-like protein [Planktothrix sp. GU0601_MAG3]|nr:MAG: glutathione binding-like protein [Planktothrix sp. GU0601_MAG3]
MAGQNHHFVQYAPEKIPYAIDRYVKETNRLYGVLNRQLAGQDYIAGQYSIADMACYPWIVPFEQQQQNLEDFPHLKAWFNRIQSRPAVVRAYEKGKTYASGTKMTDEVKKILFGQSAKTLEN